MSTDIFCVYILHNLRTQEITSHNARIPPLLIHFCLVRSLFFFFSLCFALPCLACLFHSLQILFYSILFAFFLRVSCSFSLFSHYSIPFSLLYSHCERQFFPIVEGDTHLYQINVKSKDIVQANEQIRIIPLIIDFKKKFYPPIRTNL